MKKRLMSEGESCGSHFGCKPAAVFGDGSSVLEGTTTRRIGAPTGKLLAVWVLKDSGFRDGV